MYTRIGLTRRAARPFMAVGFLFTIVLYGRGGEHLLCSRKFTEIGTRSSSSAKSGPVAFPGA